MFPTQTTINNAIIAGGVEEPYHNHIIPSLTNLDSSHDVIPKLTSSHSQNQVSHGMSNGGGAIDGAGEEFKNEYIHQSMNLNDGGIGNILPITASSSNSSLTSSNASPETSTPPMASHQSLPSAIANHPAIVSITNSLAQEQAPEENNNINSQLLMEQHKQNNLPGQQQQQQPFQNMFHQYNPSPPQPAQYHPQIPSNSPHPYPNQISPNPSPSYPSQYCLPPSSYSSEQPYSIQSTSNALPLAQSQITKDINSNDHQREHSPVNPNSGSDVELQGPPTTPGGTQERSIVPHRAQKGNNWTDISEYLNLPQTEAAKRLGVPPSTLSKRWKEAVNKRKWPWRTVCKIDKEIMTLLHNVPQGDSAQMPSEVQNRLAYLLRKRQQELKPVTVRL